jgi:tetratricopeptide (TPR) repeat protein
MNKKQIFLYASAFTVILMLIWNGCSKVESGKIPITTSSETALEFYLQGRELSDKLRAQESIAYWEKAIAEDPDFAMAYLNLSLVSPTAKGFFENQKKAVTLADKVSEGERLWILGSQAGTNGFPMKQREYYKKLVAKYPNDERAHNLLGNHYFGLQDFALAIETYQKAIKINPNFSQPYNQMGYAYRFLEHYTDAEKAFTKYIELIPDDPNPYDSYAELLMKIGKYDKSIENYQRALTVDNHFVASHIGIATNLNFQGNYKEARERLTELQQIARNTGERRAAHLATTVSYIDEGKLDKALEEVQKLYAIAESIHDNTAMSGDLVLTGNILLEKGKAEKAAEKFETALKTVESSSLSEEVKENARRNHLFNMGRVALKKNNLTEAKAKAAAYLEATQAIDNINQIRLAHELLGRIALVEKDYNRAIEELEQANLQNPYNLYRMAKAYVGNGDREMAKEYYLKTVKFNQLNSINYAFIRHKAQKEMENM